MTSATRRPLRVCHLAYTFYDSDNRVMRYAEEILRRGGDVDVIALRAPGESWFAQSARARFYRIQRRSFTERRAASYLVKVAWFFIQSMLLLTWLHARRRYDVVHVHNVPDFLVFAAVLPKLMGARVILDIHDILPELYVGKFGASPESVVVRSLRLLERSCCRFADHVIIANHLWYETLTGRSVTSVRCTALINYPDLRLFTPREESTRGDGKFILLYPGSLNRHQGLDVAIKAFSLVRDRMPDAEFHIYGDGPVRPALEEMTRQRGLNGFVQFKEGLPLKEIAPVIAAADVGVVPKRAEGFGNEAFSTKILEFMACGVPVIVSRTRVDTYYFDDTLVRFFKSGDEVDLAQAMLWVYEHRQDNQAWRQRARDFAVRNSWQERCADYLNLVTPGR